MKDKNTAKELMETFGNKQHFMDKPAPKNENKAEPKVDAAKEQPKAEDKK